MKRLMTVSALLVVGLMLLPASAWAPPSPWVGIPASKRFEWQTPEPQGNSINAVDFVTDSTGWAVGANGTVVKTTDGGYAWTQQGPIVQQGAADTVDDLNDVCFVDTANGWATGANKVWRTTNGGATWADCAPENYDGSGQPHYWSSVDFFDANHGWFVGRDRIYHTTNGGTTWTAQVNPTGSYVTRVVAVSDVEAFAFGIFEGYLATSDGGATWTERTFGGTAYESAWTDSLAAGSASRFYVATAGAVLSTSNGGSTWTTMTVGPEIEEVCVVDGETGGTNAWAFSAGGAVYRTTNGGDSWTTSNSVPQYPSSPDAPTSAAVYVTTGELRASTDGGVNFFPRFGRPSSASLQAVDFSSETTGHAVGGTDYLRTGDGGGTWARQGFFVDFLPNDVFFLESDPSTGWIAGNSPSGLPKLLRTQNGGDSWVTLEETRTALVEVCFPDGNNGWGTNNSWGGFWHSGNGGMSWAKVERAGFFWDVDFVDTDNGWIAFDPDDGTNKVLHTEDGGSTWTTQTVPPSGGNIQELDFVDSSTGWCADTFGNVYRTTDAGDTWTLLAGSPGSLVDITDIKFTNPGEGWIVGRQWTSSLSSSYRHDFAAYTNDGGMTWDYLANPTAADNGSTGSAVSLNAVDSVSGDACWVAGGGGSVLKGTAAPIPEATTLTRTSGSATLGAYGATYTFRGRLTAGGVGVPSKKVILQSGSTGSGPFGDTSAFGYSDSNGYYSIVITPRSKTYYRARFAGQTGEYLASTSSATWVLPRTWVGNPIAPKTMSASKSYTVYGYLKPRHAAGTYPVRIYKWKKKSTGGWKSYGYVTAQASNYGDHTKYSKKLRLRYAGTWRLRAYAPADSGHADSWSSGYDYVTVK